MTQQSRLVSSRLVSSRRTLAARVALMAMMGTLASCQSATLQSSNIANETCGGQPCAVPISDVAVIASGEFILEDSKLDGIRTALNDFSPEITLRVDKNGTPVGCPIPAPGGQVNESCITVTYQGGVSADPTYVDLGAPTPGNIPAALFNTSAPPLVNGEIDGTDFDLLGQLGGRDAYTLSFSLDSGPSAVSVLPPYALAFRGHAAFPVDNNASFFMCECDDPSLSIPLPENLCADLCAKLDESVFTENCGGAFIHIKLNDFDFSFGFLPYLPSTQNGGWTHAFGGTDFHLPEMFNTALVTDVDVTVVAKDGHDISSITTGNILVEGELFGCPGNGPCGNHGCDADLTASMASKLGPIFEDRVSNALTTLLEPMFNFDAKEPPLPCIVGDPVFGCTPAILTDWAAASFTYQKWSWLAGAFGPYLNGGWLPVTDIQPSGVFPLPVGLKFTFNNDMDDDGVLTPLDMCPTINDADVLFDLDGDGIGDICDRCPLDATNDADGDGICEDVDTCPSVWDPPQTNCNARAERAHQATTLGDACDPVPCPSQRVEPEFIVTSQYKCPNPCKPGKCPRGCPLGPYEGTIIMQCGSTFSNQIDVFPLASHPVPKLDVPAKPIPDVLTHARFCHAQPGTTCVDENVDIRDARLNERDCVAPAICANPEKPEDHFHRVTFTNSELNGADPNATTKSYNYDVLVKNLFNPQAPHTLNWNHQADYLRWRNNGLFMVDPGAANLLIGNFWLHAATPVGDIEDRGTGFHDGAGLPEGHYDELANSHNMGRDEMGLRPEGDSMCNSCTYIELPLVQPISGPISPDNGGGGNGAGAFADEFPSYLAWRPLLHPPADAFQRFDAVVGEADYVLPLTADIYGVPSGAPSCDAQVVTDRLGAVLKTRLLDPSLLWVNAAEPLSFQGASPFFPAAVALARVGGEDVIDTAYSDGRYLLASQDRGVSGPSLRTGSPHAIDYTAVFSRMLRGTFVLGGRDVQTNQETHEIWFNPLESIHWNVVPSGIKAEKVLAATYDFLTDELVVLDETPAGLARLWALKLRTYTTRTLGTWPRHTAWNRHWLVVDRDGSILLASSNVGAKRHAITQLNIQPTGDTEMQVLGIESGNRAFVLPPLVDARGYTLLLRQAPGNGKIKRERYETLPLNAASPTDVGGQL